METVEQTGEKFDLKKYFDARDLCVRVTETIAALVRADLTEAEGQELIKDEFKKVGVTKFWHPSKFRIGSDTVKSFRELPNAEIKMTPGDLFFLDVGPIIDDHEADYGDTWVFQDSADSDLISAARSIWREAADRWRKDRLSGVELYAFAQGRAQELGYALNKNMAGHRLGDFPHALFSKEKLSTFTSAPAANLWVLEIHVIDSARNRGAFFEDILAS